MIELSWFQHNSSADLPTFTTLRLAEYTSVLHNTLINCIHVCKIQKPSAVPRQPNINSHTWFTWRSRRWLDSSRWYFPAVAMVAPSSSWLSQPSVVRSACSRVTVGLSARRVTVGLSARRDEASDISALVVHSYMVGGCLRCSTRCVLKWGGLTCVLLRWLPMPLSTHLSDWWTIPGIRR